jgi:aminopeptidase N
MPITHFLYPENLNANLGQLDKTPNMIEIYSRKFGQYPFINEKYGHAQFGWGGGMEHQTITSLGGFSDGLIAHELAHMWFGDKITCKDWHHIWLNEGFATYGEAVIIEDWYGKASYDDKIVSEMNYAKSAVGSIWVQDISSVYEIFNGARSYAKGAVVLHMLRGIVGDSIFFKILQTYTANPELAYGVAVTEDFQAIAESVSGMDLDYFFQEWIYGENYPKYSVVWSSSSIGGGFYELALKITQDINSSPKLFTMPIKIKVYFNGGDTTITVFNNSQMQNFNISLNSEPTSITIDPDNWIMKDIESIVTGLKSDVKINSFSLEQNYPNPFNPSTLIRFSLPKNSNINLSVYNSLGEHVNTLVTGNFEAGTYEQIFDATGLASGIYVYVLKANDVVLKQKMILLK